MFHRASLKREAEQAIKGNWQQVLLLVVLVAIIYISLHIASGSSVFVNLADFLMLVLEGPILISFFAFMLKLIKGQSATVNDFFASFSQFIKWMMAGLWKNLWLTLWTLLLVIPGMIKAFSYSQYYFILAENPQADLRQALKTSMKMTQGYKGALFIAWLGFLNWLLLVGMIYFCVYLFVPASYMELFGLLLSIPVYLYLVPYAIGTFAGIYIYLKEQAISSGVCTPEEFGITEDQSFTTAMPESVQDDDSHIYDETEEEGVLSDMYVQQKEDVTTVSLEKSAEVTGSMLEENRQGE